jgi:recombinational DNA repair protein (RecF pathway)
MSTETDRHQHLITILIFGVLLAGGVTPAYLQCLRSDLNHGSPDQPDYSRQVDDQGFVCLHLLPINKRIVLPVKVDGNVVLEFAPFELELTNFDMALQLSNTNLASRLMVS